jgi:hypothetical protein
MIKLPVLFSLLMFLFSSSLCAQDFVKPDSIPPKPSTKHVVGFPVVLYSPELTWAFGGAGNYYFKFNHKDTVTRTSYFQAIGIATLRKQLVFAVDGSIFFPGEKYILRLTGSMSRFPDRFWGIGNNSKDEDMEHYTISQYYVFPQLMRNIYRKFYVGIAYESQNVFSFEYSQKPNGDPSIFETQNVPGRHGSLTSGLGMILLWDSRNNTFSSTKGFYFQYYINSFTHALGSQYVYTSQIIDTRKYVSVGPSSVLAFQFLGMFNNGNPPVRSMANIGSGMIMRGYYDGRYTDKNLMALQGELRQHIVSRVGMVVFAGAGRVANSFSQFSAGGFFPTLKPSVGAGLRVALDRKERLNIRADVGFGKHSHGVYINLAEAF